MHACTYTYACTHTYACTYTCEYTCTCKYSHTSMCTHVHMSAQVDAQASPLTSKQRDALKRRLRPTRTQLLVSGALHSVLLSALPGALLIALRTQLLVRAVRTHSRPLGSTHSSIHAKLAEHADTHCSRLVYHAYASLQVCPSRPLSCSWSASRPPRDARCVASCRSQPPALSLSSRRDAAPHSRLQPRVFRLHVKVAAPYVQAIAPCTPGCQRMHPRLPP